MGDKPGLEISEDTANYIGASIAKARKTGDHLGSPVS